MAETEDELGTGRTAELADPSVVTEAYTTLQSSQIGNTLGERSAPARLIPTSRARYPLGAGIGRSGPAAGFGGGASTLNVENEPNFLIGETGAAGLLVVLTLWLRVLVDGVRTVRRTPDLRLRLLLAALVAPVIGSALLWYGSIPTVSVPTGPLFWFVAGVVACASSQRAAAFGDLRAIAPTTSRIES